MPCRCEHAFVLMCPVIPPLTRMILSAILTRPCSVGGDERNAAASDILASIKRDSDHDFAEVHNVLTEGKKLDQHYSFSAE
jgi:hypothetical protein